MPRSVRPPHRTAFAVLAAAALSSIPACQDAGPDGPVSQSGVKAQTVGEGYQDGYRDGLQSPWDAHAGWMWLWMMPAEYQSDYERGWTDGRNVRKLRDRETDSRSDRGPT